MRLQDRLRACRLGLADQGYYEFVMDVFQPLCKEADVFPCVLDAAIFSSFDDGGWTEENLVW